MKHKVISVALIAVLLFMVLGSIVACTSTTTYDLTIASTAGGNVTTPGEGTFNYTAGTIVNLVATSDSGYRFVNWTGNVGTIANVTAATTTINMTADCTITANFALGTLIENVPDANQPPTQTLPSTNPITNYCAPMAMVNVLRYWDVIKGLPNAKNVTAGLLDRTAAEYLGWFMDTNNMGSPARANGGQAGTLDVDIGPGTLEFVRWDGGNPFLTPPPVLPTWKVGHTWTVTTNYTTDYGESLAFYKKEIDAGRPLVVSFLFWNPQPVVNVTDPETGELICVHAWGPNYGHSSPLDPEEYWTGDVGHAVTGVGYILNWDPDGAGPAPLTDYVIVHDNWSRTPTNVAIPWFNWKCLFAVTP